MSNRKPATPRAPAILEDPIRNRGAAFSAAERDELGLTGRLPLAALTLNEQVQRACTQLRSQPTSVARNVYLEQIHDRNETLYFRVLSDHLAELRPIVSGPAVGEAIRRYWHEHRGPRGIYLSIDRPGDIEKSFATLELGADDVDVIVCTDTEQVLGPGDWGAGSIQVAAGKLAIYTAAAGIHPHRVIPVSLQAGAHSEALRHGPLHEGSRPAWHRGKDYDTFFRRYIPAVSRLFPHALLDFHDFGPERAREILQAYAQDYRVFTNDVQGTGALVLAAVYAACRVTGIPIRHQTVVVFGADALGVGIADQVRDAIVADGATDEQARSQIWLVDSRGLLFDEMGGLRDYQRVYARNRSDTPWAAESGAVGLAATIDRVAPTILLSAPAAGRALTQPIIQAMCQATSRPLILPISSPTSTIEATPCDIIAWSGAKALVATGSGGNPVEDNDTAFTIGPANTFLVFPGLGLGIMVSGASRVTPHMLQAAATAIAEQVVTSQPGVPLLPADTNLQASSALVAEAVVGAAVADRVASRNPTNLTQAIHDAMWLPAYPDTG